MIGLLGKKLGMTQVFDDQGKQIPVTVLEVGPCHVTDVRTKEKDGYASVQLAYGVARAKNFTKPILGHLKKANAAPSKFIREIRTQEIDGVSIGQKVGVDNFEVGDYVDVEGVSIGRGFQGVVKRHHFKGDASMGHGSMFGRVPGSIGASSFPSRVVKGMRAAGHMGNKPVGVQSLKVLKVDPKNNLLVVTGSVPGAEGGYLMVRSSLRRGTKRKWKVQGAATEAAKENSSQDAKSQGSEEKS